MAFNWDKSAGRDNIISDSEIISSKEVKDLEANLDERIKNLQTQSCTSFYSAFSPLCPSPKSEERKSIINKKTDRFIYLDNNATHPVLESVKNRISEMMDLIGNPSSKHFSGQKMRAYLESARADIASRLNIDDAAKLFFTSSGSESNNTFIKGTAFKNIGSDKKEILITPFEHKSITRAAEYLNKFGFKTVYLDINNDGLVDEESLEKKLNNKTLLVSIMASNNELGVILPLKRYYEIVSDKSEALFHSDMSQAIGKVVNIEIGFLDSATITAHKFGGPIGVSILYIKDRECFEPIIHGGNQEFGKRASTYNTPLISGMHFAFRELENIDFTSISVLRDYLDEQLLSNFDCKINCKNSNRMVNTTSVTFANIIGDELIEFLSENGIFISSSSACTSYEKVPSHVLKSIGLTDEEAYKTVRISLSRYNTKEEIDTVIEFIKLFNKQIR